MASTAAPSLRTLVAATDFSAAAEVAVARAADLAVAYDAALRLVHAFVWPAVSEGLLTPASGAAHDLLAQAEERLAAVASPLRERGLRVETEVGVGPAATVILGAVRGGADLLVLGTRGLSGVRHALLGSTAQRVLERASCPVLVVHAEDGRRALQPSRVLAATDFSEGATAALGVAAALLGVGTREPVVLLHACEPPRAAAITPAPEALAGRPADHEAMAALRWQLADAAESLRAQGLKLQPELREGPPAETIVAAARALDADLVVLGTRGLTGLAHLLLGSTASRVVQHAGCPVLVVPEGCAHGGRSVPAPSIAVGA